MSSRSKYCAFVLAGVMAVPTLTGALSAGPEPGDAQDGGRSDTREGSQSSDSKEIAAWSEYVERTKEAIGDSDEITAHEWGEVLYGAHRELWSLLAQDDRKALEALVRRIADTDDPLERFLLLASDPFLTFYPKPSQYEYEPTEWFPLSPEVVWDRQEAFVAELNSLLVDNPDVLKHYARIMLWSRGLVNPDNPIKSFQKSTMDTATGLAEAESEVATLFHLRNALVLIALTNKTDLLAVTDGKAEVRIRKAFEEWDKWWQANGDDLVFDTKALRFVMPKEARRVVRPIPFRFAPFKDMKTYPDSGKINIAYWSELAY